MLKKYHSNHRRKRVNFAARRGCYFCLEKIGLVSFKDTVSLTRFLSPRGKILARSRSGVCARHQRMLSKAVKIARINDLLPFKENSVA